MRPRDALNLAVDALRGEARRSLLIVLATAIGVASVVMLTALGDGGRRFVTDQFASLGTNLLIVLPGRNETVGGPPPLFGETARDLTLQDAQALARHPLIARVAPLMVGSVPASAPNGLERDITVLGSTHEMLEIRHLQLAQGQFLPAVDSDRNMPVCVLGETIRHELFHGDTAVGRWIRLNDRRFRVIGILAETGESLGHNFDETAIIPVGSAQTLLNQSSLFRIMVEARTPTEIEPAVAALHATIAARHEGEDDITVITQDSVVNTFDRILSALTYALAAISAISLGVAGLLIMNVMLVAVAQRREEIGLLKALGAKTTEVRNLFVLEAMLLSATGCSVGLMVGYLGAFTVGAMYPKFPAPVPLWGAAGAVCIALVCSLVFSAVPARRAARLDPVLALSKH